jgi:short-subunit dehydrogenase
MNSRHVAVITGASSGIGLELAKLFARDGYNLLIIARNYEKLRAIGNELAESYNVSVKCCAKDLAVSSSPDEIFQSVKSEMMEVEVLVNNAGFGWCGEFSKMDLSEALEMIQVNITSLTHLTRLFLPEMIRKNNGKILNVASTAAFQPGPYMATYYATKAYVLSLSQALNEELSGTNVKVTAFCPGPTPTNFGKRAGFANESIFGGILNLEAQQVAAKGYKGLMQGKTVVIPGKMNWIGTQLLRLLPRSLPGKLIKQVQKRRAGKN